MKTNEGFGKRFPPKTIAIVGVSRNEILNHPGYTGLKLLHILQEGRFPGRIYPVNPKADFIEGLKAYPKVSTIPEPVDLATITVPAALVPEVLEDCIAASVPTVQICTSGFGETGDEEGKRLDARLREIAQGSHTRVIGPNCMGFHVPSARMQMFENVPLDPGPVAFISQSGGHSRTFIMNASHTGIGISKVISYGNALLTDAPDLLEYLGNDPETRIICMYLEGIKDGPKLFELVKRINSVKPVIIWKSGHTYCGARAASSHTGSLAGSNEVWDAFFKQTGAIQVNSIEEMTEAAMTLLRLKASAGNRAAVLGAGGGDSVAAGDIAVEEGLAMPHLSPKTRAKLLEFVALVNQGVSNPLDLPTAFGYHTFLKQTLDLLTADPVIDLAIVRLEAEFFKYREAFSAIAEFERVILTKTQEEGGKPVAIAVTNTNKVEPSEPHARDLRQKGILAYSSLRGACRALSRFAAYHRFVQEISGNPSIH